MSLVRGDLNNSDRLSTDHDLPGQETSIMPRAGLGSWLSWLVGRPSVSAAYWLTGPGHCTGQYECNYESTTAGVICGHEVRSERKGGDDRGMGDHQPNNCAW